MSRYHNNHHKRHADQTPEEDAQNGFTRPRAQAALTPLVESPESGYELRECNGGQDHRVRREREIVKLYRRRQAVVPQTVLLPDRRRVQESGVGYEVRDEAQHVDCGKVDGRAGCGTSAEVEEWLGIEGERPANRIYPTKEVGEGRKERGHHV